MLGFVRWSTPQLAAAAPQASVLIERDDGVDARNSGFVGISAAGLVALCAQTGHAEQLLSLPAETDNYTCFSRALARFVDAPSLKPGVFAHVRVFGADKDSSPLFAENDILSLFGRQGMRNFELAYADSANASLSPSASILTSNSMCALVL